MVQDKSVAEQIKALLIKEFPDVMPAEDDECRLKPMKGPKMHIEMVEGAKPVKRYRANTIPFKWQERVKQQIDTMMKKDIIEKVPIGESPDWVMSLVVVPKKGTDEPRITVDFTPMNPYIKVPAHPSKVPAEEVAQIPPGMKWFAVFDGRHGYWQVELDDESKKLCSFQTPWGMYRFRRNAMGMIQAGD